MFCDNEVKVHLIILDYCLQMDVNLKNEWAY